MDYRFRGCYQNPTGKSEIATPFFESLAMTWKYAPCHCEERSDETISTLGTGLFAGMIKCDNNFLETPIATPLSCGCFCVILLVG